MSHRVRAISVALALVVVLVSGCRNDLVIAGGPPPVTYEGPLWIPTAPGGKIWEDPGAAGRVTDCDYEVVGASKVSPFTGGEVGSTPEKALREAYDEGAWDGVDEGLQIARKEEDRILYMLQVEGRNKQAVIVRHGPAVKGTGAGPDGIAWWVESWARCNIAEFPDAVAAQRHVQVWTDDRGQRLSTTRIVSFPGVDCVPDSTFLELGIPGRDPSNADSRDVYVFGAGTEFKKFFTEPSRADVDLPKDAVDTGYERGGRHLWLSADHKRAYVADRNRVQLWPRTVKQLACG